MGSNDAFKRSPLVGIFSVIVLLSSIPFSLLYVIAMTVMFKLHAFMFGSSQGNDLPPVTQKSQTVIITGGKMSKSLCFARWFWKSGYKVVMIETKKYAYVGSRWSRAVTHFETVTCPRTNPQTYINDLVEIARKYQADYFVPVSSPVAALHDSAAKPALEAVGCRALHFDVEMTQILDNKHEFCRYAGSLGLQVPETYVVKTEEDVLELNEKLAKNMLNAKRYILKNLEYDPMHRLDLFTLPCRPNDLNDYLCQIRKDGNGIEPNAPWQVQEFINGQEYACMLVLRDGQIRAITCSESSSSQLNYNHIEVPAITKWVQEFASKTRLTGQLCFDFIRDETTGKVYPIECNPRVHSQCVAFLNNDNFGEAVLSDTFQETLEPVKDCKPVHWIYNELFKLFPVGAFCYRASTEEVPSLFNFFSQQDADFDASDPIPFLMRNHFQIPMLLIQCLLKRNMWKKIDFCIGKVVEFHGD